jgi:hypothetical protein
MWTDFNSLRTEYCCYHHIGTEGTVREEDFFSLLLAESTNFHERQ